MSSVADSEFEEELEKLKINFRDQLRPNIAWKNAIPNILLCKTLWKWVLFWSVLFKVQHSFIKRIYYPFLLQYLNAKVFNNININGISPLKLLSKKNNALFSIFKSAKLSSDILGLVHASILCAAIAYNWKKYNRKLHPHVTYGYLYAFEKSEEKWLDFTLAYFMVDELSLIYHGNPNMAMHAHHLIAIPAFMLGKIGLIGSPGHNFFAFTGECSTIFLQLGSILKDVLDKIKHQCTNANANTKSVRNNDRLLSQPRCRASIVRLHKVFRLVCILFIVSFWYCRCYLWTKYIPPALSNFENDSEEIHFEVRHAKLFGFICRALIVLSWIWGIKLIRPFLKLVLSKNRAFC